MIEWKALSEKMKKIKKTEIASIVVPTAVAIFAILVNTDTVWNSPQFDVQVSNIPNTIPVDDIVKTIYGDPYPSITADWLRGMDQNQLMLIKERSTPDDAWILDRVYSTTTKGLSQKITIKNTGNAQAHDIIIQILGTNNFKIINNECPEIISPEQITKEHGKKYLITESRMSIQLECAITINSVGDQGIERVIVTASDSNPAAWPDNIISDLRNQTFFLNSLLYAAIVLLVFIISYNFVIYFRKIRLNQHD